MHARCLAGVPQSFAEARLVPRVSRRLHSSWKTVEGLRDLASMHLFMKDWFPIPGTPWQKSLPLRTNASTNLSTPFSPKLHWISAAALAGS